MKLQRYHIATVAACCILFLLIIVNNVIKPLHHIQIYSSWSKGEQLFTRKFFLHPCVQQFLLNANIHNWDVFVMQPSLLYITLSDVDRQLLMKRGVKYFPPTNNSFLFGMTETRDAYQDRLVKKLVEIGFQYWQIVWQERNTSSHHFFLKDEMMVHVVILFDRSTFLYSPAIGNSPAEVKGYLASELSAIGKYPTSFDRFQLERKSLAGDVFQVPVTAMNFLMQFNTARFLECNHNLSAEFHRRHQPKSNVHLETSFTSFVPILKSIMDPLAAPFWLASGTLLGWYRQCGVINYTTDHDFAAWSENSPAEIMKKVYAHPELKIYHRFGFPERAFELTIMHKSERLDLFFMKEEKNYTWYAGHIRQVGKAVYFQYVYSKFTLCSAELLKLRVLVPCTPKTTIEEEYGLNWTEPVSQWSYASSPKNIGKTFVWSPSEQRILKDYP